MTTQPTASGDWAIRFFRRRNTRWTLSRRRTVRMFAWSVPAESMAVLRYTGVAKPRCGGDPAIAGYPCAATALRPSATHWPGSTTRPGLFLSGGATKSPSPSSVDTSERRGLPWTNTSWRHRVPAPAPWPRLESSNIAKPSVADPVDDLGSPHRQLRRAAPSEG